MVQPFVCRHCSDLFFGIVIIFGMISYMIKESRLELIEENIKYLQGQLKTAKENELFARTVRHDLRHHN